MYRMGSSWVGDDQRIPFAVCFSLFSPLLSLSLSLFSILLTSSESFPSSAALFLSLDLDLLGVSGTSCEIHTQEADLRRDRWGIRGYICWNQVAGWNTKLFCLGATDLRSQVGHPLRTNQGGPFSALICKGAVLLWLTCARGWRYRG